MLAIRMQRTGRKGHAMFRVVVQDARRTPSSGKVVSLLGSYDPHNKTVSLDKEKAATFMSNGAQPSDRVALLFKSQGIKLPSWVEVDTKKSGKIRNQEKLRKNRTEEPKAEASEETAEPAESVEVEQPTSEAVSEESPKTEEVAAEAAEESKPEEPAK